MYECICQLAYEYHALCLISALFLRNLFSSNHTDVRSQRGAQDSCFCDSSHGLLPHCRQPAQWQQKTPTSVCFCQPRVKRAWVEEERSADQRGLAIKSWVRGYRLCRSTEKASGPALLAVLVPAGQGLVPHMSRYRYTSASSVNRIAHSHCCV